MTQTNNIQPPENNTIKELGKPLMKCVEMREYITTNTKCIVGLDFVELLEGIRPIDCTDTEITILSTIAQQIQEVAKPLAQYIHVKHGHNAKCIITSTSVNLYCNITKLHIIKEVGTPYIEPTLPLKYSSILYKSNANLRVVARPLKDYIEKHYNNAKCTITQNGNIEIDTVIDTIPYRCKSIL
jgi:hypothetical protein